MMFYTEKKSNKMSAGLTALFVALMTFQITFALLHTSTDTSMNYTQHPIISQKNIDEMSNNLVPELETMNLEGHAAKELPVSDILPEYNQKAEYPERSSSYDQMNGLTGNHAILSRYKITN